MFKNCSVANSLHPLSSHHKRMVLETVLGTPFTQRLLVFICRSVVRHYTALESAFLADAICWYGSASVALLVELALYVLMSYNTSSR
nr:hypothetical protein [Bartonella machadoae]